MRKEDHLPREHPHADAFLGARQANAASSVWRDDRQIAHWLFKACVCGEDTPVVRERDTRSDAWVGTRLCRVCGLRWDIELGGEHGACGASMTEPLGLWLHRQRYRWSRRRWLDEDPRRKITFNVEATRHRESVTPTIDDLVIPSWPRYFGCRAVQWLRSPRHSARKGLLHAKQFIAPYRILTLLHMNVMTGSKVGYNGGWVVTLSDEPQGRRRTVQVHLITGSWSLHIEDIGEADRTAPWPPIFYVSGDDMLELVGRLAGVANRHKARAWLQHRGYSAPERIGLQRVEERRAAAD